MRRTFHWIAVAAVVAGCQQAPVTKPRILSVQTPAGVPPAPSLNTTRNNPLIVPTAPVGRTGVVAAPAVAVPVPTPPPGVIAPPANVIQVPAAPGVQGVQPPNTIAQPPQYPPTATVITPAPALAVPGPNTSTSSKRPEALPGPVTDSTEKSKRDEE